MNPLIFPLETEETELFFGANLISDPTGSNIYIKIDIISWPRLRGMTDKKTPEKGPYTDKDVMIKHSYWLRNRLCSLCGETVTARMIIDGWIIKCGCGEIHRRDISHDNKKLWTKITRK